MNPLNRWYVRNLGDALLAGDELERIKQLFQSGVDQASDPSHMAIYIRHESDGRLHCEVKLYFTPATAAIAEAVNARPCPPPSPFDLGLFAGVEQSWPGHASHPT